MALWPYVLFLLMNPSVGTLSKHLKKLACGSWSLSLGFRILNDTRLPCGKWCQLTLMNWDQLFRSLIPKKLSSLISSCSLSEPPGQQKKCDPPLVFDVLKVIPLSQFPCTIESPIIPVTPTKTRKTTWKSIVLNLRLVRFLVERIITLLTCSPLDPEHVSVLKSKHRAEREMLRQCLSWA